MINILLFAASAGDSCNLDHGGLFNFPTWYKYLHGQMILSNPKDPSSSLVCNQSPQLTGLNDVWLVVAAIIEIMLRIAVLAAVAMIVYGAVTYTTSQGEPEKTSQAKATLVNAVLGLAISVTAAFIVAFIAGSIT